MAYSTDTTSFNPDLNDVFEEAFERCGLELRTGYDFRTARRSLNFLLTEWANKGINLWTIEQGSINMVQGQTTYDLPDDTVDPPPTNVLAVAAVIEIMPVPVPAVVVNPVGLALSQAVALAAEQAKVPPLNVKFFVPAAYRCYGWRTKLYYWAARAN